MKSQALSLILTVALLTGAVGCYHANVDTGLASAGSAKKIWAHTWIYGLVPPSTVVARDMCPDGVAKVETQLTFVNGLVGALTFGIYTPMEIAVTCATRTGAAADSAQHVSVASDATHAEIMAAFQSASDHAVTDGQHAYVVFEGAEYSHDSGSVAR